MKPFRLLALLLIGATAYAQNVNFSSTIPAAPTGGANIVFQHDNLTPVDISGNIPSFRTIVSLWGSGSCTSGYLKFDGTCGTGGGGATPGGTAGAMQYYLTSTSLGGLNGTGFAYLNGAGAPTVATTAQITTTVNSVPCAAGGACTIPTTVCGGSGTSCPLQQINPTTGATTTTTASITISATTIPVASCTGFTFVPGSIIAIENISQIEWVVATACSAGNLTVSTRGFYGTTANAWASGSTVVQMTAGNSTSASVYPYFYQLANGAIGYGPTNNIVANSIAYAIPVLASQGFTASGSVTLAGGSSTLYSPQSSHYNGVSSTGVCFSNGTLFAQHSDSVPWFAGSTNASCTTGTNLVPPNSLVFVPGTTGSNPLPGAAPAMTITPAGVVNVPTGGSYNINGVPITGGTTTNCSSTASPAVCGSAAAGSVLIPTGTTSSTLTVNTTAVTANSQIFFYPDDTLGTKLSTTCNSTLATLAGGSFISGRVPGTSFTITFNGTIATAGVCGSYYIVN